MIRRNVIRFDREQRVVKRSLLAAAVALSLGFYAQTSLHREAAAAEVKAVVTEAESTLVVQPEAPKAPRITARAG